MKEQQTTVAALYVETNGAYFGMPDVDPWDEYTPKEGESEDCPVCSCDGYGD